MHTRRVRSCADLGGRGLGELVEAAPSEKITPTPRESPCRVSQIHSVFPPRVYESKTVAEITRSKFSSVLSRKSTGQELAENESAAAEEDERTNKDYSQSPFEQRHHSTSCINHSD